MIGSYEIFLQNLQAAFAKCKPSDQALWQPLMEESWLRSIHQRLEALLHLEVYTPPAPQFAEETTPDLKAVATEFSKRFSDNFTPDALAEFLTKEGFSGLLLLAGQRTTPGSFTDHRAIPPTSEKLLHAGAVLYKRSISVAARALTKHAGRAEHQHWEMPTGNDAQKNATAQAYLISILNEKTWWNIFFHYKHGPVYEARLANGSGARWSADGATFIGFLEAFLD